MTNKITKIPPLRGTPQEQIEALRKDVNRMADEILSLLEERDREIKRLRQEVEENG